MPAFSPDSQKIAFLAKFRGEEVLVLDGKKQNISGELKDLALCFSPDSKQIAYVAKSGNDKFAVVNEKQEKPYADVGSIIFSPNLPQEKRSRRLLLLPCISVTPSGSIAGLLKINTG